MSDPQLQALQRLSALSHYQPSHHPVRCLWSFWIGLVYFALVPLLGLAQRTPEDDTLQAMWQHGLTETAITYAERQRQLSSDRPELHARWTVRLMECCAQAALQVAPKKANALSNRCSEIREQFVQTQSQSPRLPWLTWQLGRCKLLQCQGDLARYLAAPANEKPRENALNLVREILVLMEELADDIRYRQPLAARQGVRGGDQAPAKELAKLLVDAGLLQCEALLVRSNLYPTGSTDRIAACSKVETLASDILATTPTEWDARGALEIARATAQLEIGQADEGMQKLTSLARSGSSSASRRACTIAVRQLANQGDPSRARAFVQFLATLGEGPDLELAKLQVALAEYSSRPDGNEEQLAALLNQAKNIGTRYGGYWRNRADALLLSATGNAESADSGSWDLVLVDVRQMLAGDQINHAIERLLSFRDNEQVSGRSKTALQATQAAVTLMRREKRWLEAAETAESTATGLRSNPLAAETAKLHLTAVTSYLEALRSDMQSTSLAEKYESCLVNQLETWPDSQEAMTALPWLEQWLRGKQRWVDLSNALLTAARNSQEIQSAQRYLNHWHAVVLKAADDGQTTALDQLFLSAKQGEFSADVSDYAQAVGWYTRLASREQPTSVSKQLDELLLETARGKNDNEHLWQALRMFRYAQSQDLTRLKSLRPDQIQSALPELLRPAGRSILAQATAENVTHKLQVWAQALSIDNLLAATDLDPMSESIPLSDRATYWQLQSLSEQPANRQSAIEQLRALATANPRNARVQLSLADSLAWSDLAESTRIAKLVAANSPPGSLEDLRARWRIIKNLKLENKDSEASQAAELFLARQPITDETWLDRFEATARQE